MGQHFKIITACRNAEKWIGRSVQSVQNQIYDNWQAIVIDDCSTDKTWKILQKQVGMSDKYLLIRNKQRKSKLVNFIDTLLSIQPDEEDVLVMLDGDDWFYDEKVLKYLAKIYKNPDIWLTWGSYIRLSHGQRGCTSIAIPKNFNIRRGRWIFSHLKTFKYFLWQSIKDKDFRTSWSGEYYPSSDDAAFMYPMVEMAGSNHRKFIKRTLYVYNDMNPLSMDRIYHTLQVRCIHDILKKPRYSQINRPVN